MDQPTIQMTTEPRWRRRRYRVAGAVVLTALLGTGLVVVQRERAPDRAARVLGQPRVRNTTPLPAPTTIIKAPPRSNTGVMVATSVSSSGSLPKDRRTLRVVWGRGDLTGQQELALVADAGRPVGSARCTQNFAVPPAPARVRPTMLMCWRTSPTKSVYTMLVDVERPPSEADSVAALDRVWATFD